MAERQRRTDRLVVHVRLGGGPVQRRERRAVKALLARPVEQRRAVLGLHDRFARVQPGPHRHDEFVAGDEPLRVVVHDRHVLEPGLPQRLGDPLLGRRERGLPFGGLRPVVDQREHPGVTGDVKGVAEPDPVVQADRPRHQRQADPAPLPADLRGSGEERPAQPQQPVFLVQRVVRGEVRDLVAGLFGRGPRDRRPMRTLLDERDRPPRRLVVAEPQQTGGLGEVELELLRLLSGTEPGKGAQDRRDVHARHRAIRGISFVDRGGSSGWTARSRPAGRTRSVPVVHLGVRPDDQATGRAARLRTTGGMPGGGDRRAGRDAISG